MGVYYELYIAIAQAAIQLRNLEIGSTELVGISRRDALEDALERLDQAIAEAEEAGAI